MKDDLYYLLTIAVIRGTASFPGSRAAMASGLARLAYHSSRSKRSAMERNVRRALGDDLAPGDLRQIVLGGFREFWTEMLMWCPSRHDTAIAANARLRGLEHLDEALNRGRGAILWEHTGVGRRFLAKQILRARGYRVHQVHGPNNVGGFLNEDLDRSWVRRSIVRRFFDDRERRQVEDLIYLPNSGSLRYARTLANRLARNDILCVSADGRYGRRLLEVDFLGHPARFSTGMLSLARQANVPLLPIFCDVEEGRAVLTLDDPIRVDESRDRESGLRHGLRDYVTRLEKRVRREPHRFRNWHIAWEPGYEVSR